MHIQSFKAPGLAQLSYVVADPASGEAVVIDPRRDTSVYLQYLAQHQWVLTGILETHRHADFISGAMGLQAETGAPWRIGPVDPAMAGSAQTLEEGETIALGSGCLTVRHVPGHSPEHVQFLLHEEEGKQPWAVFTGDFVFADSIGRPDLSDEAPPEELAKRLFASLRSEFLPLDDGMIVFPGHGAGSACGPSIGPRDLTSVGHERTHNAMLQIDSESAFVKQLFDSLEDEPRFYRRIKKTNTMGTLSQSSLPHLPYLSLEEFEQCAEGNEVVVVDGRETEAFCGASIPGSLNLPVRDSFPVWAGRALRPEDRILLVGESNEQVLAMREHLFRIGLDRLVGALGGGFRTWIEGGKTICRERVMGAHDLSNDLSQLDGVLLDVRSKADYEAGTLPGARHCPITAMAEEGKLPDIAKDESVTVFCGSDFRATLAASLLRRHGYTKVGILLGSMKAWKAEDGPMEEA